MRRPARSALAALALGAGLLLATGEAAAATGSAEGAPTKEQAAEASQDPAFQLFPPSELYPRYVADPRGPEMGAAMLVFPDPGVADSGERRVGLKLGGRFGLARIHGWQVDIEAGFTGQFDVEHSLDNLGWDGTYGLLLSTVAGDRLALQIGAKHVSSHVGDEYAERTGRRRIGYTREELAAGAAWTPGERWRAYAEAGWGYAPRDEIGQEPGRLQLGLEHEAPGSLGRGRLGWYAALDLGAMEERGWQVDPSLEVGLLVPSAARRWRLGLACHSGTVPLGEFFRDDETYVALGVWLDT